MKTLLVIAVLGLAAQQTYTPQAIVNRHTGKVIATYVADDDTLRLTPAASKTMRICIKDICKTPDQWLGK